ncbi:MAG: hypothetical protein JHC88_23470, partial [Niveispirillum sp.]|nr:hypothetical protein [Niveispirillum sp.]
LLPVPDLATSRQADTYVPPRTELEREMVTIWRDVLGVDAVGINDNFFDIGGNSLLLLKVGVRMEHLMPRDDVVIEFFRYPTIAALARFISGGTVPTAPVDAGQVQDRTNRQRAAARQQAARRLQTRG